MNVVTALGDEKLNILLKKEEDINVIGFDIQYQDGIFEILEKNKNIEFIILNINLIGELNYEELIEKIKEKNKNINLIIFLEKENEIIKNKLIKNNIKFILNKNEFNLKNIINILKNKKEINLINKNNKKNKLNKNNYLKINIKKIIKIINNKLKIFLSIKNKKIVKYKNKLFNKKNKKIKLNKNYLLKNKIKKIDNNYNFKKYYKKLNKIKNNKVENKKNNPRIISFIGDKKSGKTILIILISFILNKKILIISFNKNKEINIMLGLKNNNYEELIKINKKINLIKCKEESLSRKDIQKEFLKYNFIFIDTSNLLEINLIKKITNEFILILEPNLIGINNSKKIIEKNNLNNKKIKIIINKNNIYSINKYLIKFIFSQNKIIGKINYNNYFNYLINKNFKIINLKIKKEILKIIKEDF